MKTLKLFTIISTMAVSAMLAADGPITGFSALGNNLAAGDWFTVVDVSDTSASVNGTNKKILTSDVGLYYISDTVYSSAFNGVTDKGASKNSLYDYLHLADADDDGKIDVLDLAAAGFPAINSSGALVGSRTLSEDGAKPGIDITNPTGAAGDPAFGFDSTEIGTTSWSNGVSASFVWTNDLSGTDTVWMFSSGIVNLSTGTLQVGGVDVLSTSSTNTLTNKTFDASATGNVIKFKSLPQFTSPLRVDGTGCTIGTTSTSVGYGLATYAFGQAQATNLAQWRIVVPADWDTTVDPTIKIVDMIGADTGVRRYIAGVASIASSGSSTSATGTGINIDIAADAGGVSGDIEISATTTLTGWGAAVTPGQMMIITIARDGTSGTDTSSVNSTLIAFEISYGAAQ